MSTLLHRSNAFLLSTLVLLTMICPQDALAQSGGRPAPDTAGVTALETHRQHPTGALATVVSLHTDGMPLEEVLREIGRQARLVVVFNTDLAASKQPRASTLDRVPAVEALLRVLDGTGLRAFVLPDGKVLVTRAADMPSVQGTSETTTGPSPQGQTVRGRVLDRDARIPLPGANVIVLETDPLIGTTTDGDGRFVLPDVPLGRQAIQVSFIGYAPVILPEVLVTSGKEVVLDVALKEQILTGQEIVVVPEVRKDQPLNDQALVSARSFSVEETRRYAGGLDDPARMASAFAGVTTSVGLGDNALIIRGNAPRGVLWRLEGVEIPNPNHFAGLSVVGGGGLTLFSSQLLDDSDFFTGAFPAEYGNALAGVFDMHFRTGNPNRREHTFQVGIVGIDVASEGPFVRGRPATYLFNYRYSTLALLMPLLPTDSDVLRYQDLSFKVDVPTRRAGRFEAWGIGGIDGQTMEEEPDSAKWEYELWDRLHVDLELGVGAAGLTHTLPVGRRSYLRSSVAASLNRTILEQERLSDDLVLEDNLFIHNTTGRVIAGSFLNHRFGARHVNRTGFTAQQLFYDLDLRVAPDDEPPVVTVAQGTGSSLLLEAYSQSTVDVSSRLAVNAGLHAQHFALTGRTALEPRAGLRWAFVPGQAFSFGYGLHSQIEDLRLYFVEPPGARDVRTPNRELDFAKAHHGVAGYDRRLGEASRLKLEAYYQYLFDVPVIPDSSYSMINFQQDWSFNEVLVNDGAGENYGVELTVERFLKDGFYYLVTGSLFRSRYRGGDGVWRRTRYDQGYAANALFGREFTLGDRNNLLGLNGRLAFVGGQRRSPVDVAGSLAREEVVYDERRAFTVREPGVFLLDLTLTYRRNHRRYADVWALQVKNVLVAKDVYLDYNFATDRVEEVREGFPVPMLSYKVEF